MPARDELVGLALAASSAAAYGASSVVLKLAVLDRADVLTLVAIRLEVAALLLWLIVLGLRISRRSELDNRRVVLAVGTLTVIPWLLSASAVQHLPVALAGLLVFTYPAWVTGLEIFLKREPFSWGKSLVVGVGLVGIALLLGVPQGAVDALGVLLGLAAGMSLAVYVVAVASQMRGMHPLYCSAVVMTGGAMVGLPLVLLGTGTHQTSWVGWPWILLLGGLSAAGIAMFVPALSRVGATRASIASNLQPIVTIVLAAAVLGEQLGPVQVVGDALIVVSVGALPFLKRTAPQNVVITSDTAAAAPSPHMDPAGRTWSAARISRPVAAPPPGAGESPPDDSDPLHPPPRRDCRTTRLDT